MSKNLDFKCEETLRDSPPVPQSPSIVEPPQQSRKMSETHQTVEQISQPGSSLPNIVGAKSPHKVDVAKTHYPMTSFLSAAPNASFLGMKGLMQAGHVLPPNTFQNPEYLQHFNPSLIKNVAQKPSTEALAFDHSREISVTSAPKPNVVPKIISLPTAVTPRCLVQKSNPTETTIRPVTLHINTGKGTAVVQLQQPATTISASPSKSTSSVPQKRTVIAESHTSGNTVINFSKLTSPTISSLQNVPSRIFPSPISLPPTAPTAYLYQDHITAYQTFATLQNLNKFSQPIGMHPPASAVSFAGGAPANPRIVWPVVPDSALLAQPRFGVSPLKSHSSPGTMFGGSPNTVGPGSSANGHNPPSSVASTPGQSPRPSILRKRPTEMGTASISSVAKKLTYDSATAPRKLIEGPSTLAMDEVEISTSQLPEHPDSGNSNHSSSASTVSAGSTLDGHSNSSCIDNGNTRSLSPSPRKRPRKQCLDDLPERTAGDADSEEERLSTETVAASEQSNNEYLGKTSRNDVVHESTTNNSGHLKLKTVKLEEFDENCGGKASAPRNPRPSLWSACETSWQPRRNHFLTYDDVRGKEEKKMTAVEICNQKQIWQKIEGWRLHLIGVHADDLEKCEDSNLNELNSILCTFDEEDDQLDDAELESMREMVKTSMQRCKAVKEEIGEMKKPLNSILKHKRTVETLVQKFSAKRLSRKKEKVDF